MKVSRGAMTPIFVDDASIHTSRSHKQIHHSSNHFALFNEAIQSNPIHHIINLINPSIANPFFPLKNSLPTPFFPPKQANPNTPDHLQ